MQATFESKMRPATQELPCLSEREAIVGVRWASFFPLQVDSNTVVNISSFDKTQTFFKNHYSKIYEVDSNAFGMEISTPSKADYYRLLGDFFEFQVAGKTAGFFVGTLVDWSSYYFRNCSLLPDFQGRGLYQKLLHHLLKVLESSNVARVEGDISPSNHGHIHILNKLGFKITGFNTSDRAGAMVHFTKFIRVDREDHYVRQLCLQSKNRKGDS